MPWAAADSAARRTASGPTVLMMTSTDSSGMSASSPGVSVLGSPVRAASSCAPSATMTMTVPAVAAASGCAAVVSPAAAARSRGSGNGSTPVTVRPAACRRSAIGRPMAPRPRNVTCSDMDPPVDRWGQWK